MKKILFVLAVAALTSCGNEAASDVKPVDTTATAPVDTTAAAPADTTTAAPAADTTAAH